MTWVGSEALTKKMDALGKKTARKALRPALEAGAEVIRTEARRNATAVTNAEIGHNVEIDISGVGQFKAVARVGVPGGRHPGFVLRFFEHGTAGHKVGPVTAARPSKAGAKAISTPFGPRASANVGGIRANPWLRPAYDTKREAAMVAMGQRLWQGIAEASRGAA